MIMTEANVYGTSVSRRTFPDGAVRGWQCGGQGSPRLHPWTTLEAPDSWSLPSFLDHPRFELVPLVRLNSEIRCGDNAGVPDVHADDRLVALQRPPAVCGNASIAFCGWVAGTSNRTVWIGAGRRPCVALWRGARRAVRGARCAVAHELLVTDPATVVLRSR